MLYTILAIIAVIILLFIAFVAMQPSAFRIERSATMGAPPAAVFGQVNDFHNWTNWSPWEKLDPNLKRTYDGPSSGQGAIYSWEGNNKVGAGRMTITESRPSDLIRINLEFLKPFKATNTAEFAFQPNGNQTNVNWSMTGQRNFVMKGFCLFMNMDKLVGGDFEKGLAQMKSVVETGK
jgi:Polyketide cyclase / dehydrase and lipid transport